MKTGLLNKHTMKAITSLTKFIGMQPDGGMASGMFKYKSVDDNNIKTHYSRILTAVKEAGENDKAIIYLKTGVAQFFKMGYSEREYVVEVSLGERQIDLEEWMELCISAGFKDVTENPNFRVFHFNLGEGSPEDYEDCEHPPHLSVTQHNNSGYTILFASGFGQEFVHLNTNDPFEAIEWGRLISHIEPNW